VLCEIHGELGISAEKDNEYIATLKEVISQTLDEPQTLGTEGRASFLLCGTDVVDHKVKLLHHLPALAQHLHFRIFELVNLRQFFEWFRPDFQNCFHPSNPLTFPLPSPAFKKKGRENQEWDATTLAVYDDIRLFHYYAQRVSPLNNIFPAQDEEVHRSSTHRSTILLACDIEATDKDASRALMLEIALIVTDLSGKVPPQTFHAVVHWESTFLLKHLSGWSLNMHRHTGLLEEVGRSTTNLEEVERQCCAFVRHAVRRLSKTTAEPELEPFIFYGSNTGFDRECLQRAMPKLAELCVLPNFDVSVLLMFFSWFRPDLSVHKPTRSKVRHRAANDIQDSLNLFRFYQGIVAHAFGQVPSLDFAELLSVLAAQLAPVVE
jgi:oligoribonuclease (3'-5' exoribonuclease)